MVEITLHILTDELMKKKRVQLTFHFLLDFKQISFVVDWALIVENMLIESQKLR